MHNPAAVTDLLGRGLHVGDGAGQITSAVAAFRLDEAWRALQIETRRLGIDLDAAVSAGDLTVDDIADVVAQATMRVLRNPGGVTDESGSIDDYTESRKYGDTTQDVYFTAAELRRLTPTSTAPTPTAGSIPYS